MVNKYCEAKLREQEYKGRPSIGEPKKAMADMIPAIPFSLNQSINAHGEEVTAQDKENRKQIAVKRFNTQLQKKVNKRMLRDEKRVDMKNMF